ncbi:helix-turn-helix transcriptional regulator [Erwinia sp. AnSW2-5]|uniref:helix-turn-helix transcriptional regulator n=1 Tax=Erwinia sp. AnSW2-5 TaxID=3367692 RepID=UPI00385969B7
MSRAQRLLDLLQLLRNHRFPITAEQLACELRVSTRTLYRDIATLQQQGADIVGEAGLGYVLKPGFTLPPLMFNTAEIAALVLGSRWVARRTDNELAAAAHSALSKIAEVLPADLRSQLELSPLMVGPAKAALAISIDVGALRQAISQQNIIEIDYLDLKDVSSRRRVWPIAIGFFDSAQVLVAWCETREDYRHFRLDRFTQLHVTAQRYQRARTQLMKAWRERHNIPAQGFGY